MSCANTNWPEYMMGNSGEKTTVSQKIYIQVGDTPKHSASYYRSINYITVRVELPDTTDTGYINLPSWGIHFHPGKHEPLISFDTWQKIQDRLKAKVKAPTRKDLNQNFPLRGFITCGNCNQPMTSCWSRGRSQKYPYYLCQQKNCVDCGKSVRKEKIESEFESLLINLHPSEKLFCMALEMFRELWDDRISHRK